MSPLNGIVYVARDGALRIHDPEGEADRPLTPDGMICTWPSCAPNGRLIAFSGLPSGGNGHGVLGIYIIAPEGSMPQRVYLNEIGTDAIAPRTPHYLAWSPDSRTLAFIAQTREGGLTLFLHEAGSDEPPRRLIDGGPLYFSWSYDSRFIMVHSGTDHYLADLQADAKVAHVPGVARQYLAPSWSPAANRIAMFQDTGRSRQELVLADIGSGRVRTMMEVDGIASVAWSPDGATLGMARGAGSQSGYFGGLWLVNSDTGDEEQITDDQVLSFFWSPEGDRIAYVTPSEDAEGSIRFGVVRPGQPGVSYLADFRPTQEQFIALMFFDQYRQSHPRWSRDGSSLLFSGVLGYERERQPLPDGLMASIIVADTSSDPSTRAIGRGTFGAWLGA